MSHRWYKSRVILSNKLRARFDPVELDVVPEEDVFRLRGYFFANKNGERIFGGNGRT